MLNVNVVVSGCHALRTVSLLKADRLSNASISNCFKLSCEQLLYAMCMLPNVRNRFIFLDDVANVSTESTAGQTVVSNFK
jgi:hypothetical protein